MSNLREEIYAALGSILFPSETRWLCTDAVLAIVNRAQERANQEAERLRTELDSVLGDWNDMVKASGSKTSGGAIGHLNLVGFQVLHVLPDGGYLVRLDVVIPPTAERDGWKFWTTTTLGRETANRLAEICRELPGNKRHGQGNLIP